MAPSTSVRLSIASLFVYSATVLALPHNPNNVNLTKTPQEAEVTFKVEDATLNKVLAPRFFRAPQPPVVSAGAVNHAHPSQEAIEFSRVPSPTAQSAGAVSHGEPSQVAAHSESGSSNAAAITGRPVVSASIRPSASATALEMIPDPRHSEAMSKLTKILANTAPFTLLMHSSADAVKNGATPEATGLAIPFLSEAMAPSAGVKSNDAPKPSGPAPMAISLEESAPIASPHPASVSVKASAVAPTVVNSAIPTASAMSPLSASAKVSSAVEPVKSNEVPKPSVAPLSASVKVSSLESVIVPVATIIPPLSASAKISAAEPIATVLSPLSASIKISSPAEPIKSSEAAKQPSPTPLSVSVLASAEPLKNSEAAKATIEPSQPSVSVKVSSAEVSKSAEVPKATIQPAQPSVSVKASSADASKSIEAAKIPAPSNSAVFFTIKPSNSIAIVPSQSFDAETRKTEAAKPTVVASASLKSSAPEPSAAESGVSAASASIAPASLQSKAEPSKSVASKASVSAVSGAEMVSSTAIRYSIKTSAAANTASDSPTPSDPPTSPTSSKAMKSSALLSVMKSSAAPKPSAAPSSAEAKDPADAKSSAVPSFSSSAAASAIPAPASSALSASAPETTPKPSAAIPGKPVGVVVMASVTYTIAMLPDGNLQFGNGAVVTANAAAMVVDGQTLSFGTDGLIVNHSSTFPVKATGVVTPSPAATPSAVQPKAPVGGKKPTSTRTGGGISSPTGGFSQGEAMRLEGAARKIGMSESIVALVFGLMAVMYLA